MRQRRSPVVRRIVCARCDKTLADPSARPFSAHTRLHFCTDIDACGLRAARRNRRMRKVAA